MRRILFAAAGIAGLASGVAPAQGLVDPTRPPQAAEGGAASGADAAAPSTQLQSVLISSGRRVAVINGKPVAVGERYGEARVARITETEVVLRTGDQIEVLKLFPGVEKTSRRPEKGAAGRAHIEGTKP